MAMTERDKKVYDFLVMSRLPFTIEQIGCMFYNSNGNIRSAYTVASRRISVMCRGGYLEKQSGSKFGSETIVYAVKPSKQLRHQLTLSKFIYMLMSNGFRVTYVDIEHSFKDYGIRCDGLIEISYNKKSYTVITEVNLNTEFNPKYDTLTKDLTEGKIKLKRPVIFVNISDHKFNPETFTYCKPVCLKTDLSNFSKFQYLFVK
ncbi:hypothetical protein GMB34_11725 [Turicibacter sanguinis]|nr:hypothetical protein [Turicibacter sanguinis]MTN84862.1 hypothetical protein [Turicibacter sanguinis]MTN87684.1 hypothetical protein [Turicibacter sanguinis]MTN90506.1 hypothetical protein [Turicibacter sanguinis]MTN93428.1 hypothetical protein [Turicibacter sanguinis]